MERINIEKRFGAAVKDLRKRPGMTQEELSQCAGLQRTCISELERGVGNISLKSVEKLADTLGISVSALFSRNPVAKPLLKDFRSSERTAARSGRWRGSRRMDSCRTG